MADLDKAGRQNVKQKAPDELGSIQRHGLPLVMILGISPAKSDLPGLQLQEPAVGETSATGSCGIKC